ncbi:MAG: helix-turn-helix domain-containing protein [Geobacteraceae bacterium]|nr:helix-turn-helix domain-containing protein [Geobacteraceae bacterium]
MPGSHLTVTEKLEIAALFADGVSAYAIAKRLGRDYATVTSALKTEDVTKHVRAAQENIGLKCIEISDRILSGVCDADIEKAPLQVKLVSAGIAIDKARLSLGLTTDNVGVAVTVRTNSPRLQALLDE